MTGSTIYRDATFLHRSRNARAIFDYARKSPVERIDCQRLLSEVPNGDRFYSVTIFYDDGAIGQVDYADWRVLVHIIKTRRSWDVQRFTGIPEFVAAMRCAL